MQPWKEDAPQLRNETLERLTIAQNWKREHETQYKQTHSTLELALIQFYDGQIQVLEWVLEHTEL